MLSCEIPSKPIATIQVYALNIQIQILILHCQSQFDTHLERTH